MLATLGAALGVLVALCVLLGLAWRWVVLPNLREQLFKPVAETNRQVSENSHRHAVPTLPDRIRDIEQALEAVGLNQQAILKSLSDHVGESSSDRAHLWLIIEALIHEGSAQIGRKHRHDSSSDTGGA